jgi:hypothetical protein
MPLHAHPNHAGATGRTRGLAHPRRRRRRHRAAAFPVIRPRGARVDARLTSPSGSPKDAGARPPSPRWGDGGEGGRAPRSSRACPNLSRGRAHRWPGRADTELHGPTPDRATHSLRLRSRETRLPARCGAPDRRVPTWGEGVGGRASAFLPRKAGTSRGRVKPRTRGVCPEHRYSPLSPFGGTAIQPVHRVRRDPARPRRPAPSDGSCAPGATATIVGV